MIGGHSDLTLGAIVGDRRRVDEARTVASTLGQTGNPFESWLALRGLATLSLRMEPGLRHGTRAGTPVRVASRCRAGVLSAPSLAPRFRAGFATAGNGGGTIVTIDLVTRARAEAFIRALAASIPFAPSLGDVQTTLSHPATTSHRGQDDALLGRQGLTAGTVRVSVGLEEPEDLWQEVLGALAVLDRS